MTAVKGAPNHGKRYNDYGKNDDIYSVWSDMSFGKWFLREMFIMEISTTLFIYLFMHLFINLGYVWFVHQISTLRRKVT